VNGLVLDGPSEVFWAAQLEPRLSRLLWYCVHVAKVSIDGVTVFRQALFNGEEVDG
jgi:hypothetical protein